MIQDNMVVAMNYTLRDKSGKVLDSSEGNPFEYIQGHQNIIPGLEKALAGLQSGDKKLVEIPPEEGYGDYNPELKFSMPVEQFGGQKPEAGMMVQLNTTQGESFMARVLEVQDGNIILDANHPLAGETLVFDVEITNVRQPSQEELSHGHPHGPGGHHH